jgi:predicted metal-dependent phosphotriesterase family hydrolase
LHVVQDVIPVLRERGVGDSAIDQMMRENGRVFFER